MYLPFRVVVDDGDVVGLILQIPQHSPSTFTYSSPWQFYITIIL